MGEDTIFSREYIGLATKEFMKNSHKCLYLRTLNKGDENKVTKLLVDNEFSTKVMIYSLRNFIYLILKAMFSLK